MSSSSIFSGSNISKSSVSTNELWNRAGTVPGMQCGTHSGRAEGYGFLATLTFLEHYCNHAQITVNLVKATIQAYCNNLGLIQKINQMLINQIPNPSWATANNYDLHVKIFQTIWQIPIPISLYHVKGHQDDETPVDQLPYAAQLNI